MTRREAFEAWLRKPADCGSVIYHCGFLMRDRAHDPELARLAQSVLEAANQGKVALVQRRVGGDRYDYIARLLPATA